MLCMKIDAEIKTKDQDFNIYKKNVVYTRTNKMTTY